MTDLPPSAIIGCLLDVSGSMRDAIEAGQFDERATDRLHVVLRAAMKLAKSEQQHNPKALIFIDRSTEKILRMVTSWYHPPSFVDA